MRTTILRGFIRRLTNQTPRWSPAPESFFRQVVEALSSSEGEHNITCMSHYKGEDLLFVHVVAPDATARVYYLKIGEW